MLSALASLSGMCHHGHHHHEEEDYEDYHSPDGMDGEDGYEGQEVASSGEADSDTVSGFFFSVFFGFLLLTLCSLCCKCLRCFYKRCCCPGGDKTTKHEYPGAGAQKSLLRRDGDNVTVVYVGLPAKPPEDVPALGKL